MTTDELKELIKQHLRVNVKSTEDEVRVELVWRTDGEWGQNIEVIDSGYAYIEKLGCIKGFNGY